MDEQRSAERAVSMILQAKDCVRRYRLRSGIDRKFIILGSLCEYENRTKRPITLTQIAQHTGVALPNVGRLLKPLEDEGLLRRERQGRTVHIVITPEGEALLAGQRKEFIRDVTAALSALTQEEQTFFLACCAKILARLETSLKEDAREAVC